MKKSYLLIILCALAISLTGCGLRQDALWTVLIYMDGDNNLSDDANIDISEMEDALVTDKDINIVVQVDNDQGVTTKRYIIKDGKKELISDLGELDMAAPQTITDFLKWGKDNYPAQKTAVILWNHGNGWDQLDGPVPPTYQGRQITKKSVFFDDDNGSDFLPNSYVRQAIEDADIGIDILGFDASSMGTFEMFYEFKGLAGIIIASQEVGQSSGWDYTRIFTDLDAKPEMDSEEFSTNIVASYKDHLENIFYPLNPSFDHRFNISAIRTAPLKDIAIEIDTLATTLSAELDDPQTTDFTQTLLGSVRNNVQDIDLFIQLNVYVDLLDLDALLGRDTNIGSLMKDAVLAEYHGDARPNANGISIVFYHMPEAITSLTYDENYANYDATTGKGNSGLFIMEHGWDELLNLYYTKAGYI